MKNIYLFQIFRIITVPFTSLQVTMKKKIYISIQILQIKQNKYIRTKLHQICSFLHIKMGFPLQQRLQVYDYMDKASGLTV